MTNNTEVYTDISGLSMHTYAWSIITKSGQISPEKRGEDPVIPFFTGRYWVPKFRDGMFYDMPMWVRGYEEDGSEPVGLTGAQKLEENWRTLMAVMNVDVQVPITKRWWEGTTVKSATAMGEMLEPPTRTMVAQDTYEFTASFYLADPTFYGDEITAAVGALTVQGDAPTSRILLQSAGGRVDFPDGNWVEYDSAPTGGATANIDMYEREAKVGSSHVNGLITRNRTKSWPTLAPGAQTLVGSGTIKYRPAYKG